VYSKIIGIMLFGMLLSLPGCSSSTTALQSFTRENANIELIQKVAVLPFEGGGRASRIREFTMTQLLATGVFDLVDKGRVDVFLQQEAIGPGAPIDVFTIRRLGESLKVEAILLGSVEQISEARGSSNFSDIIMTLRLIECESGELLWQASGKGSGYSLADRLFGFAPKDVFEVTLELLDDLFATMDTN
jgi:PBP1b-binding outer membrane lipoprotein LpoB